MAFVKSGTPGNVAGTLVRYGGAGVGWKAESIIAALKKSFINAPTTGTIMAPPTITIGVLNGASVIARPKEFLFADARFLPANKSAWTFVNNTIGKPFWTNQGIAFDTYYDGQKFEVFCYSSDHFSIYCDEGEGVKFAGKFSIPYIGGQSSYKVLIDFATKKQRRVIVVGQSAAFAGFIIEQDALMICRNVNVISAIADSYGEKTATFGYMGPISEVSGRCASSAIPLLPIGSFIGGTGYNAQNPALSGNNFISRAQSIIAQNPKCVVVMGGINDATATLTADVSALAATLRAGLPQALLVFTGAWNPNSTYDGSTATKNALILDGLASIAGPWIFLDNYAGTWMASNGTSGTIGGKAWLSGEGRTISFTGAVDAATSATLAGNWAGATGSYTIWFSDGTQKVVTLTLGSASVTWTGAVTASAVAGVYAGAISGVGNRLRCIGSDGIHPVEFGCDWLGALIYQGITDALASF